jgi:pimeloyl-ACP methyl ester carboxylesterase
VSTRVAYLHGFASGPQSRKGQWLKETLRSDGVEVAIPDLNVPSFRELSLGAMIEAVDALDRDWPGDAPWRFVGSSLGGYLAARYAELRPDRVARLLLLCPAFDLAERWPALLPDGAMERWERGGSLVFPDGAGQPRPVHYAFYEEALALPAAPDVTCPTVIVHGTRDDRVPIDLSRGYAEARDHVTLDEVDDGHDLLASTDRILAHVRDHLLR